MAQHFDDRVVGSNFEQFVVLLTRFGIPIDLTGATSTFSMSTKDGTVDKVVDAPCAAGTTNGRIVYQPTVADLDTPGRYWCRTKTVFPGGEVFTTERVGLLIRDDI